MLTAVLYTLCGYLLGSILFAEIASKLFGKDIVSDSPDGNYGSANAFRYGGFLCGAFTLLLDIGKGFLPVFLYCRCAEYTNLALPIVMSAPVLGHVLPVFSRFKGGKAIAVTFGSLMGLFPNWRTVLTLAFFFLLFSIIIRVNPHRFRMVASYISATMISFMIEPNRWVSVGMLIITVIGSLKMISVHEDEGKLEVKWIGSKHNR